MSERNELVARLREGTFGSDITKTDAFINAIFSAAADQIMRDGREIERLRRELRLIAKADEVDMLLDPTWASRNARAALNGEGET